MPVYEYEGYNRLGKTIKGVVDASGQAAAKNKLREQGIYISSLTQITASRKEKTAFSIQINPFKPRVNKREQAIFLRQLATLLNAGLPLLRSLNIVTEQMQNSPFKKILVQIKERINEGASLSTALSEHPHIFNQTIISMIKAGENSGTLELVMERLADMTEQQLELTRKVQSALAYPLLLLVAGISVIFFLMGYIVPRITKIFFDLKHGLPLPTTILIAISNFFQHYWWALICFILLSLSGLYKYKTTHRGKRAFDQLKLRFPLLGSLYIKIAIARFTRTLGTLLNNHVALTTALQIVKGAINNEIFSDAIALMQQKITQGVSMADAMQQSQIFPLPVVQMVSAGEQSGKLGDMLLKLAKTYENEVSSRLAVITSLLEPVMILFLGGVVGFVVLAVLLPIFEMSHLVR